MEGFRRVVNRFLSPRARHSAGFTGELRGAASSGPDATALRFRERMRVMLPAVYLREVLGWHAEALETIRKHVAGHLCRRAE